MSESTVNKVSAHFFTFVDSRQQIILYFSGSMYACRNIHEKRRVGLYIKGVSHSDMGTEKTIIKDLKGSGDIVGITNQKYTLVRWTLTTHGSMYVCRNIHETRRVGLYIKGVSHGFVQMAYYCLDLFLISLQITSEIAWHSSVHGCKEA
jgi:hypothetical protein